MIKSMTAFGRGEAENPEKRMVVEIRTLNHRFLDLHFRLPRRFWGLEERLRKLLKAGIARGRVELNLEVVSLGEGNKSLVLDRALLREAQDILEEMRRLCTISETLQLEHLLRFPELITVQEPAPADEEATWEVLSQAVFQALEAVETMRQAEGQSLATDLQQRLELINRQLEEINTQALEVPRLYRERLEARLPQLLPGQPWADDSRLLQEVALLADRADISEELTRLRSHLEQFQQNLAGSGAVGRKLDFLLQEMNREINTIGAKANDLKISQAVVEVKNELERLREQVQNIE
ncbi:MAG: YicC family protein [Deltaproteobacteria bacterium]|nr:YicC family protein [Deltaproteobacteria bacterium]MBW1952226.1 YicC family protein [Deltaproteobacteria bacterium]MBW1985825.1 YicC family protein [Deltaproteobacteria bacterium]MBW2133857.1 YicC family protein [Deltaproteobacteria bacterium]